VPGPEPLFGCLVSTSKAMLLSPLEKSGKLLLSGKWTLRVIDDESVELTDSGDGDDDWSVMVQCGLC